MLGRILVAGEHWIYKNAAFIVFTKEGDTDYIIEKKWDKHQNYLIFIKTIKHIFPIIAKIY